jgi:hypothetical protein
MHRSNTLDYGAGNPRVARCRSLRELTPKSHVRTYDLHDVIAFIWRKPLYVVGRHADYVLNHSLYNFA